MLDHLSGRSERTTITPAVPPRSGDDAPGPWPLVFGAVLIVGGALAALALTPTGRLVAAAATALIVAVGLVATAAMRFEWFILGLLATRSALDLTDPGGYGIAKPAGIVAFVMVVAGTLWLFVNRTEDRPRRWSVLSLGLTGYAMAAGVSLLQLRSPAVGVPDVLALVSGLLMLLVVERLLMFGMPLSRLVLALAASAIVPLVMPLVGPAVGVSTTHLKDGVEALRSTFVVSNSFALFLVPVILIGVPVAHRMTGRWRWALWLVVTVAFVELLLTNTRGAWIGVVIGVIVLGVLENRRLLLGLLLVGAVAFLTMSSVRERISDLADDPDARRPQNSFEWRQQHWEKIIDWNEDRRLVGIGYGMVRQLDENQKAPHNDYVKAFVETGWIGLGFYVTFMVAVVRTTWRASRRAVHGWVGGLTTGIFAFAVAFAVVSIAENLIASIAFLWYAMALVAISNWIVHNSTEHDLTPVDAVRPDHSVA